MKKNFLFVFFVFTIIIFASLPASAQMTQEEREIIVEEVIKRLDIESVVDKVLGSRLPDIRAQLKLELRSELALELEQNFAAQPSSVPEQTTQQTEQQPVYTQPTQAPAKSYVGPHVKFVNSYGYANGGSVDGGHEFKSEYYPNELFTVDVVFENDGNAPLPPNLELRHTGNTGEYTGHTESAFSYGKTVKPGERIGFSFAAHGSENIGAIVWNFQLFDSSSGNPVNGGYASYYYTARP